MLFQVFHEMEFLLEIVRFRRSTPVFGNKYFDGFDVQ